MIHIEQHQLVPENSKLRVLSVTGDYSDNDAIECYNEDEPEIAVCSYQAQFIKYGGLVYRYNTPEELGAALVQLDPESTHNSALLFKEDEERRLKRLAGTLVPENPVPADEAISPIAQQEAVVEAEQPVEEEAVPPVVEEEVPAEEPTPTPSEETPPTPIDPIVPAPTSTPAVLDTASSTPSVPEAMPTSTPSIIVPDATSTPPTPSVSPEATSTPEVLSVMKKKATRRNRA